MRSRLLGAVLALAALPAMDTAARAQKIDPQEIVNQHWPAQLERPEGPVVSNTCHAVMATTAAGEPARIAAGYWDGAAVLRVIERDPAGRFRVVFEASDPEGIHCHVTLLDIDSDGTTDILFEVANRAQGILWVYRSSGGTFEDITPLDAPGISALNNATVIDLDHQGPLELSSVSVAELSDGTSQVFDEVYAYRGSRFVRDRDVLAIDSFSPTSSPDVRMLEALEFDLKGEIGPGASVLRIINGDRNGRRRARGVSVTINGTALQEAAKLTASVEFLDIRIPTALRRKNELRVVVTGLDSAEVIVVVGAAK